MGEDESTYEIYANQCSQGFAVIFSRHTIHKSEESMIAFVSIVLKKKEVSAYVHQQSIIYKLLFKNIHRISFPNELSPMRECNYLILNL